MRKRVGLILSACALVLAACSAPVVTEAEQSPVPTQPEHIVTEQDIRDALKGLGLLREADMLAEEDQGGPTVWFVAPGLQNCWIRARINDEKILIDKVYKPIDDQKGFNGVPFDLNPKLVSPNLTQLATYAKAHPLAFANCTGSDPRRPTSPLRQR